MQKKKVLVVFGGMSTEHEVSRVSSSFVLQNIDKALYDIKVIGIDKTGEFLEYTGEHSQIPDENWKDNCKPIVDIISFIKECDVALPILHGLYGEDGTIQGLFELLKIPYIGCKVLASSVAMDKVYTKIVLDRANIPQVPSVYLKVEGENITLIKDEFDEVTDKEEIFKLVEEKTGYPAFVKPSNSGSSVGVFKVCNREQLVSAISEAKQYDKKILIEKGINCREIECAILEKDGEVNASVLGEILPAGEFYSYESKYQDENSSTQIPANIDEKISNKIRETAIKAFKAIDGSGLSRVDFFIDKDTGNIYLNEINTLPGFTSISMYPKLWENTGIPYTELINILIRNAK
ncbi:MAG: D-alanine--D-alanine ligase [Clostridia bacterium]|nr:D-alanine--D-alanine ligase [Clostridia bacterium]